MKKLLIAASACLLVAACGSKGDEIVFDKTVGPNTKAQVEPLPKTLEGDHDNARYSGEAVKGEGMTSADGTGQQ